jgi:hypothetical protein
MARVPRQPLTIWERLGLVAGGLAFAAFTVVVLLIWNFERPPIDLALLERLRAGMSRGEVEAVLGAPTKRFGDREWLYSRRGAWPIVRVWFDAGGGFVRSVYDP